MEVILFILLKDSCWWLQLINNQWANQVVVKFNISKPILLLRYSKNNLLLGSLLLIKTKEAISISALKLSLRATKCLQENQQSLICLFNKVHNQCWVYQEVNLSKILCKGLSFPTRRNWEFLERIMLQIYRMKEEALRDYQKYSKWYHKMEFRVVVLSLESLVTVWANCLKMKIKKILIK